MELWPYFFQAQVGASAALVGLIFVSISISLPRILAVAHLPARAAEALLDLLQIFIVASLMLVPQPTHLAGIEIAGTALAIWVLVPAVILSYLVAVIDAWVLLIEVNR